jgi:hypothetical protein
VPFRKVKYFASLHKISVKNALRSFISGSWQASGYESVNSFERLSLVKRMPLRISRSPKEA